MIVRRTVRFGFLFVAASLIARNSDSFSTRLRVHEARRNTQLAVVIEKGASSREVAEEQNFFIRNCLQAEIGQAADILTDCFFKNNTNFVTYQWERLTTYLSLEGTYPKPGERHALFVACDFSGQVLGLAEIDDRPSRDHNATPRPYMFNVAVDPKMRRQGVAKALVRSCEDSARIWGTPQVFLKVRDTSEAAIAMYESLGYETRSSKIERLNNKYQNLLVMSKDISRAVPDNGLS